MRVGLRRFGTGEPILGLWSTFPAITLAHGVGTRHSTRCVGRRYVEVHLLGGYGGAVGHVTVYAFSLASFICVKEGSVMSNNEGSALRSALFVYTS